MPAAHKTLAFLSPTQLGQEASGLAMRAEATADFLSRHYQVRLTLPRSLAAPFQLRLRRFLYHHSTALYPHFYSMPGDWDDPSSALCQTTSLSIAAQKPERIHVFRHYMVPYAAALLGNIPCQLDLDESESRTRLRLAVLARQNGHNSLASIWEFEAHFYAIQESEWLPRFDQIFVSSESERDHLLTRFPTLHIKLLPNTIRIPAPALRPPHREPFTFLFVGKLNYYPNDDALRYFTESVLPILEAKAKCRIRILVTGGHASTDLRRLLACHPSIEVTGYLPSLDSVYAAAHAAIIPLRAGGGTRIKALEAFAHRLPIISTSAGIEGLSLRNEEHFLLADDAESFAHACLRLIDNATFASEIAERAYQLVRSEYSADALGALL